MDSFADRLAAAVESRGTPLCVGLDPRWDSLPAEIRERSDDTLEGKARAYEEFCLALLEVAAPLVGVVKPQSAFFEACGPAGFAAQASVMRRSRELGLITILDNKRGDIASTASAYADAAFDVWNADALTVSPYLGEDAVEPFLATARGSRGGVFILVRTSNPGSGLFQELTLDGEPLYRHVARAVARWNAETIGNSGYGDVGAVVGATHPNELRELRNVLPNAWFLVPGYGAQGGKARDVMAACDERGFGAIINSSRGVAFPFQPSDPRWRDAIAAAIRRAIDDLRAARP
jgi:orotidine-5'-phosphate decarboxylase